MTIEAKHELREQKQALIQALEAIRSTLLPVLRDHEVRDNKERTASFVQYALDQIDAAFAAAQE